MANNKPHSIETRLAISQKMLKNQNASKNEYSLEGATKLLELSVEYARANDNIYFIGQLADKMGTTRFTYHRLIHEKFPEELQELGEQLYGTIEKNLWLAVAEKRISDKVYASTLKAFHGKEWNPVDKKEIETNTKTTIVWKEELMLPNPKTIQYVDISPKPKQLTDIQDIDEEEDLF